MYMMLCYTVLCYPMLCYDLLCYVYELAVFLPRPDPLHGQDVRAAAAPHQTQGIPMHVSIETTMVQGKSQNSRCSWQWLRSPIQNSVFRVNG